MTLARKFHYAVASTGVFAILVALLCLTFLVSNRAVASINMPLVDAAYFAGIDTVYVAHKGGYNSRLLPWPKRVDPLPPDPAFLGVKKAFAQYPQITVISTRTSHSLESYKSNVVTFFFETSAQPTLVAGKVSAVASLGLQVRKRSKDQPTEILLLAPATYPFVVPDKSEDLDKSLIEATRFLTAPLVPYFPCLKGKGSTSCP